MCSDRQISASVDACLALMGGEFCLQGLQANDPNYSWEFRQVHGLAEEHGITGLYTRDGVLVTVFFDDGMSPEETNLAIAHELGHHWLHMNLHIVERQMAELGMVEDVAERQVFVDEQREREAEAFGELLLDRSGIRRPATEANA